MKHVKKLASVLLTMVMVMAMTMTAFAEGETTTCSITINNSTEGHTYEAYQIFTGDLSGGVLSNIEWGAGISEEGQAKLLSFGGSIYTSAADLAAALTADNVKDFAKAAAEYLTSSSSSTDVLTEDGTYVISGLTAGYYLVKDQDDSLKGDDDAYTSYILEVLGNEEVTPKSDVPEMTKKVKDTNDSTDETSVWQDSADYDIGDDVPFQLSGTVADNYADYDTYYFAFHDKEETGLTFNADSVKVYVDGDEITTGYTVVTDPTDGCTFEVIFADLKKIASVEAGSEITVEYTSKLNSSAVLGSTGNVNKANLEFSNNPNEEQSGDNKPETGETPWDNVIVFTYKVVVNKVDGDGNALAGAGFTLEKKDASGNYVAVGSEVSGNTTFEWKGLDDGEYRLVETTTPAGYNTIDPIEFTVNADHTITWDGEDRATILTELDGGNTFTGEVSTGTLTAYVKNYTGSTLPETGGMGTTIFYVIGSILVLGAAVVMITRKRMAK